MENLTKQLSDFDKVLATEGYLSALNQQPPSEWVETHPYIKGHKYLPIDKVEFLLRKLFKTNYKIEVLDYKQILNSMSCDVRVHYLCPLNTIWLFHDGLGACEIQTIAGTGCLKLDASNINRGAIQMALPIAKSLAVKDACDHIGRIFGADLNRKNTFNYSSDVNNFIEKNKLKKEISLDDFKKVLNRNDVLSLKKAEKMFVLTSEQLFVLNEKIKSLEIKTLKP